MPDEEDSERLEGGWQTDVHRVGDVVLRSPGPQSTTVIRLLTHLRDNGFDAAPEPVGGGFAPDGREQVQFIEGSSPHPSAWSDDAVWRVGSLLRALHDVASTFDPGDDATWKPWFGLQLAGAHPVIGHGDLGLWNVMARDTLPVAFIDWDNAGPVDAVWELAQVTWLNAQLHDDNVAELNDRSGFVDKMIEFELRSARDEARVFEVGPDTPSPATNGFPLLWAVTWRFRAATWMLDHREQVQRAIT